MVVTQYVPRNFARDFDPEPNCFCIVTHHVFVFRVRFNRWFNIFNTFSFSLESILQRIFVIFCHFLVILNRFCITFFHYKCVLGHRNKGIEIVENLSLLIFKNFFRIDRFFRVKSIFENPYVTNY